MSAARASRVASGSPASIGVSKVPGAIVQTRTADRARSRATGRVSETTPPLEALYAAWPIWPSNAAIEAVLTITPRSSSSGSCSVIAAAASRSTLKVPTRLTATTFWKRPRSWGPSRPTVRPAEPTPAQLTATRSSPSSVACAIASATWSGSGTSAGTPPAPSPRPAAAATGSASGKSMITTPAPAACSRRAVALPSPEAPPVTNATDEDESSTWASSTVRVGSRTAGGG